MKKTITLSTFLVLFSLALFSQQEIPAGFESIYDVVGESALAPDTADGASTLRLLGPVANWNADLFDFTDYKFIDVKIRYHMADTGKQVALRYYANGSVNVDFIDLPTGDDTTYIARFVVQDYAREDDSVKFGGLWLYNGSSHWSFSYTGDPATEATIVDYVAIKKKADIPDGYVSIYSLKPEEEMAPYPVDPSSPIQFLGPANGWGESLEYDFSNYEALALKMTFSQADTAKEAAVRFSVNGTAHRVMIDLPTEDTSHIEEIALADYADEDGKVLVGGIVFYHGASHWSFTFTDPATQMATIDYLALKTISADSLAIEAEDEGLAKALPFNISVQLNAVFTPANTSNQAVTWSSGDEDMATVDSTGLVTAKSISGDVVITAVSVENDSLTADYTVKITGDATDVTGVSLTENAVSVKIGFETTLEYNIEPANASIKSVTWSSADTNIATVDENGIVTGVGEGDVIITVTTDDGGFTDECTVTVEGYLDVPVGYESLYNLIYDQEGVLYGLDTINGLPGADVPGMFTTIRNDVTASLLGPQWNWNSAVKYTDVSEYTEIKVAVTFKESDLGKDFLFRYAFSGNDESVIVNRTVVIDGVQMFLIIDLMNDTADIDGLKRIGAIKFAEANSGSLDVIVDYVALKKASLSSVATLSDIKLEGISLFGFNPATETYDVNLSEAVAEIVVTATPTDNSANVVISDSGTIDLTSGSATATITVTAEDGTTIVYKINFSGTAIGVKGLQKTEMNVYPTISDGLFNIEFNQIPGTISVFDIAGNKVLEKTIHKSHEVINLSKGLHFIKLESNGISKIVKIVCN